MTHLPTGNLINRYGETTHAHHMKHCQQGGTNEASNCVLLCQSCHYIVHEGGNYRNKAVYLSSTPADYVYFYG